jgi:hypothetical protein
VTGIRRIVNSLYELGRNTLTPGGAVVDVRFAQRVQIHERMSVRILAEAFNLQNRANYTDVNITWAQL